MANNMSFPYVVEYASDEQAECEICKEVVAQYELRIAKNIQSPSHDGTRLWWYHIVCFYNSREPHPSSVAEIGNYDNLRWDDQQTIKRQIVQADSSEPGTSGSPPAKRRMKKQNEMFHEIRDELINLNRSDCCDLLSHNNQRVPKDENALLNALADAMVFGAMKRCNTCSGNFEYVSRRGYVCTGAVTEWTNCLESTQDPSRIEFVVPEHLKYKLPFLLSYDSIVRKRIVLAEAPSILEATTSGAFVRTFSPIMSSNPGPNTLTLLVRNAGVVDPLSGLAEVSHIYQRGRDKYNVTLAASSAECNKNSFYVLQILVHENNEYCLYRRWGRIGPIIGDSKTEFLPLEECIEKFETLFTENTGNEWSSRANFVKVANKMYPVDTDYGLQNDRNLDVASILKRPVLNLMKLIFDVHTMKQVMREYNLDLVKMPLGKLSQNQLLIAYRVLTELRKDVQEMNQSGNSDRFKVIDASNRFYTLVPHSFDHKNVPIINTEEAINAKCKMMRDLLEIETACGILGLNINSEGPQNPLDVQYERLHTEIDVLDKNSVEYNIIQQYVNNTHGPTHNDFGLDIEQVFVIKRQNEEEQYEPFSKFPNRKLLWHGSRLINYAGILSQGLRIAPGEAQRTGGMFGNGIYFADVVSKSAGYCYANMSNTTGLLLLCEVALGNMYECYDAEYITNLPSDKHSTLGLGRMQPNPTMFHRTEDDVEIPCGTILPSLIDDRFTLDYNEYVVYKPAQVKVKYLVQVNFKWRE